MKRDNEMIRKMLLKKKDNDLIKQYFFDENGKIRFSKYLFFDFMIVSSINLNEGNITILDKESKIKFISKILSYQIQDIKLKEIIIKAGIRLFLNENFPKEIKRELINNSSTLLRKLQVNTFLDLINRNDLEKALEEILKKKYKKDYANEFMRVYNLIKEF